MGAPDDISMLHAGTAANPVHQHRNQRRRGRHLRTKVITKVVTRVITQLRVKAIIFSFSFTIPITWSYQRRFVCRQLATVAACWRRAVIAVTPAAADQQLSINRQQRRKDGQPWPTAPASAAAAIVVSMRWQRASPACP